MSGSTTEQPKENLAVSAWTRRSRIYRKMSGSTIVTDSPASRTPRWLPLPDPPARVASAPPELSRIASATDMTPTEKDLAFLDLLGSIGRQVSELSRSIEAGSSQLYTQDGQPSYGFLTEAIAFCAQTVVAVDLIDRATSDGSGSMKPIVTTVRDAARSLESRICTLTASLE